VQADPIGLRGGTFYSFAQGGGALAVNLLAPSMARMVVPQVEPDLMQNKGLPSDKSVNRGTKSKS